MIATSWGGEFGSPVPQLILARPTGSMGISVHSTGMVQIAH
jgi:hypothetical protein